VIEFLAQMLTDEKILLTMAVLGLAAMPKALKWVRSWQATSFPASGTDGIANAKSIGWAIYAAGSAISLFGYLSASHAPLFDWKAATPWWISSFVPNLEAELGLALMFASMIPTLPWARIFPFAALLVFGTLTWCGFLVGLIWHVI
jgi:hypothetical protein